MHCHTHFTVLSSSANAPLSAVGHYVYIETSAPRVKGDKAWFLSPTFTPGATPKCMSFWYHMLGTSVGE